MILNFHLLTRQSLSRWLPLLWVGTKRPSTKYHFGRPPTNQIFESALFFIHYCCLILLTQSSTRWVHDANDFCLTWHVFEHVNDNVLCLTTNKLSICDAYSKYSTGKLFSGILNDYIIWGKMHVKAHSSNDAHWAKVNPGFSRNRPRMKRNGSPRSFIWRRGEERYIFHLQVFCSR